MNHELLARLVRLHGHDLERWPSAARDELRDAGSMAPVAEIQAQLRFEAALQVASNAHGASARLRASLSMPLSSARSAPSTARRARRLRHAQAAAVGLFSLGFGITTGMLYSPAIPAVEAAMPDLPDLGAYLYGRSGPEYMP